jgi:hypothetical protein
MGSVQPFFLHPVYAKENITRKMTEKNLNDGPLIERMLNIIS